jgi:hypothetical protein
LPVLKKLAFGLLASKPKAGQRDYQLPEYRLIIGGRPGY